jgi:hypothetical protein
MKESLSEKVEIYKLLLSRRIILVLAENLLYLVYAGSCKNEEVLFLKACYMDNNRFSLIDIHANTQRGRGAKKNSLFLRHNTYINF